MKKEFLSFDLQIEKLKERGLIIENKIKLKNYLINYNYESLINGYNDFFMKEFNRATNLYWKNSSSENIINLFNFDKKISYIILPYLFRIERKLSTLLAHNIVKFAIKKNVNGAKDGQLLKWKYNDIKYIFPFFDWSKKNKKNNIKNFKEIFVKYSEGKKSLLKYKNSSFSCAPIWKLSIYWSFNQGIKIFKYLQNEIKIEILKEFKNMKSIVNNKNIKLFEFVFILLNDIRNIICHNNVLFKLDYSNNFDKLKDFFSFFMEEKINMKIRLGDVLNLIYFILRDKKIFKEFKKEFKKYLSVTNIDSTILNEIIRFMRIDKFIV